MLTNHQQNLGFDPLVNLSLILKKHTQFYLYLGKTDSIDNDVIEENSEKKTTKESLSIEVTNDPPVNLRLRITPSLESPISLGLNDNNNNTNEESSIETSNNKSHDQDIAETIYNDEELIDQFTAVKNDQDGISFRIKLINEDEPQWMSAKIANRKYPQAVIAFWKSRVEFT
jgi:hypothetical protein